MAAICPGIMNTSYQVASDSILLGGCGSFAAFPETGSIGLFINPTSVGACSTDIQNGVLFTGSDIGNFIIDKLGVLIFVQSFNPGLFSGGGAGLFVNPGDGAAVLAIAELLAYTGFMSVSVRHVLELCMPFYRLGQGGGLIADMASSACPTGGGGATGDSCACPVFANVRNTGADIFKAPNCMVLSNTSSIQAVANFSPIIDADGDTCITAIDVAAVTGSNIVCAPASCPVDLSSFSGIVEIVNFTIEGLACVALC